MPRHFNRKVEIRFDDISLQQIDRVASALGLSRAEFMRVSVMSSANSKTQPETLITASTPPLTVNGYHRMVSNAYKATGGAVSHIQVETCVAAALQVLFLSDTVL
jgi:hypothetical protein